MTLFTSGVWYLVTFQWQTLCTKFNVPFKLCWPLFDSKQTVNLTVRCSYCKVPNSNLQYVPNFS